MRLARNITTASRFSSTPWTEVGSRGLRHAKSADDRDERRQEARYSSEAVASCPEWRNNKKRYAAAVLAFNDVSPLLLPALTWSPPVAFWSPPRVVPSSLGSQKSAWSAATAAAAASSGAANRWRIAIQGSGLALRSEYDTQPPPGTKASFAAFWTTRAPTSTNSAS
eukprot:scaffold126661_cov28-Tisochrysis_lutea.AAC.7